MEPINIPKRILNYDDETLKKEIENDAFKRYAQTSKPLQVDTVLNLIRGRNTFLLAATGFGKSRIPEIFTSNISASRSSIVEGKPLEGHFLRQSTTLSSLLDVNVLRN
ncbi:hypothetical protein PCANC_26970 [Puccinia coronata f. sp. avenae]|uniref:Uncharacterized protein n=1 Tax=Puccinia coronata f. sp. avenae TaxID=200324 RepID=A0A2N5RWN2_9BASI|nr:hypothetical protein PCANC_26970 [Puccinia coronata f. sp. avenae]